MKGIAAAPGLAEGPSLRWHKENLHFERLSGKDPQQERQRIDQAVTRVQKDLSALRDKMRVENHADEAAVFDAHILMLEDPSLMKYIDGLLKKTINAEAAWMDGIQFFAEQLAALPDDTLQARSIDIIDAGSRVLSALLGVEKDHLFIISEPCVIIAQDLTPSETASLDKSKVLAFCIAEGGPTSHTAILARAYGIPAVVGLGESVLSLPDGTQMLVDGTSGQIIANPDQWTIQSFTQRKNMEEKKGAIEYQLAQEPAATRDGISVEVVANVSNSGEAESAIFYGAEGIGLFRTEFLFLKRQYEPSEEEQLQAYRQVLDVMEKRPVVVRTIDVGGDKDIPYLNLGKEDNPFLGWRAVRMCLERPEFFKVQLRALWRASQGHDLRIMFPMIATLEEVRKAKALLMEAHREVVQARHKVAEKIQVGIMVETPSAAIMADRFVREVNFFSIGTNDLTQYTLAADRDNPKVAHLGDPCHPAVLRQIKMVIDSGHAAGIWVGVCGEMASDPDAIPVLLGLGLDEFSMAPSAIPHAKYILRQWSTSQARQLAEQVLDLDSAASVRQRVRDFHVE
ncbi:MAG: phosphoenolpyruvate--protein phosphotransferase [Anaerolineales bacterium]|nr:phosphoenolpyruvate--protein phosphotransferase [Anaerolineales bacterium]